MNVLTSRREFIASLFATGALPAMPGGGFLSHGGDAYSVLVLGDVSCCALGPRTWHSIQNGKS